MKNTHPQLTTQLDIELNTSRREHDLRQTDQLVHAVVARFRARCVILGQESNCSTSPHVDAESFVVPPKSDVLKVINDHAACTSSGVQLGIERCTTIPFQELAQHIADVISDLPPFPHLRHNLLIQLSNTLPAPHNKPPFQWGPINTRSFELRNIANKNRVISEPLAISEDCEVPQIAGTTIAFNPDGTPFIYQTASQRRTQRITPKPFAEAI